MSIAFNSVTLVGRLVRDPEEKVANSGTVMSRFTIAVDRQKRDEDKADFFNITAFGNTAEFVNKYLVKGRLVLVEGRLQIDQVEKDGEMKYYTNILANRVVGLETKKRVAEFGGTQEAEVEYLEPDAKQSGDDEIPF